MHIKEHDNVYIIENETWVRFTQMREGYDLFYNVSCGHGQQSKYHDQKKFSSL